MSTRRVGKGARYSIDEVSAIVEGYEELREVIHKPWIFVRLMDITRAYAMIPSKLQEAVLLCGLHGMSTRIAAPYAKVSHTAVAKRYVQGLEAMTAILNGEFNEYQQNRLAGSRSAISRKEVVKLQDRRPFQREREYDQARA